MSTSVKGRLEIIFGIVTMPDGQVATLTNSGIASSQILGNKKMPLAQKFLIATYRQADTCRSPVSYLSRNVGERLGVSRPVQSGLRDQRIHSTTVLPSIHHFAILAQSSNGHASRRLPVGTARRLTTAVINTRRLVIRFSLFISEAFVVRRNCHAAGRAC